MRRGQRDQAGEALDRAITRFGGERGALVELATLASRWGEQGRALTAWKRLRRLDPSSEVAIIGLGEAEFQHGHKDEARRTWAALRDRDRASAGGHLRLAEILLEHDFVADAIAEARRGQAIEPRGAAAHRLLAQLFERERKIDDAITEWNVVLALADGKGRPGDEGAALRREARVRLLGLYARQGRGRLHTEIRKLAEEARSHPNDTEAALFLAEAQVRAGDMTGAMTTLRGLVAGVPGAAGGSSGTRDEVRTEAAFTLVQLLKRTGQLEEAVERLDAIAHLAPGRAREAHLQIADIALARYDSAKALDYAARAAAGADGATLARVADIEARSGAESSAVATYRKAVAQDAGAPAALALSRLLARQGDAPGATEVLDDLFATSTDDDTISEAGRMATDLGELLGRLPELERRLADGLTSGRDSAGRRRTLVAVLKRLLPPLYRDPLADELRAQLGRRGLRALLDLVTDADAQPDRAAIELVGMLGNGDAAPALARIALRPRDTQVSPPRPKNRPAEPTIAADAQLAAVIALGRLGEARGRSALEQLASAGEPSLRAAAVWALGRIPEERTTPGLIAALQDRRPEVVAAACLGLGRRRDEKSFAALVRLATDGQQAPMVRRAALISLGRSENRRATATLIGLLDAGDDELAHTAALALAWSRDPQAVAELLVRALLPRRFALVDASAPLAGLDAATAGATAPDEARLLSSSRLEIDAALASALIAPPHRDLLPLVRAHAGALRKALAEALRKGGEARREALAALDARPDGPALGPLTADEGIGLLKDPTVIQDIVLPLADPLAALADDPDLETRAAALQILAKLGDERLTPARVTAAVLASDGWPALATAAAFAASRLSRDRPEAAAAVAAAVVPVLEDESWRRRLAAVEVLAGVGPAGVGGLERARGDRHILVRAAAVDAGARRAIDLPAPPSRMP
jgi:HEAT repeat protein/predicted Zn-dependent protease